MSFNRQHDLVVEPLHTAEFDRIAKSSPLTLLVAGVVLFLVSAWLVLSVFHGSVLAPVIVFMGVGAIIACSWMGLNQAVANTDRLAEITRPLEPLRSVVAFDPDTVPGDTLWEAAGLAIQLAELEETYQPLADARLLTPAQERELADLESSSHILAGRILTLIHPDA